ncbi:MBL fold metallo-hydrolase [Serratia rubidaea]|uniref:MBL fold metallo-hydrolase n=1 Tax=Serratia rubidaea TaxID=61652 RepID=A0A3S4X1K6_SERRU|nr:MBL fold metallo-hydrolase [Serratia rubidaea]MBH1932570.1 MBL fold metallo-hydrolase [Serratia rubidaea]MDC6119195.1 MBL fold metallo-hydrolase [Serratia rubidaea]MEB7584921.1 MBL fold metallo-hydrolase [Serratia rubidaea]VEI70534.1 ribonuclease Z [Serratia rubidaea]
MKRHLVLAAGLLMTTAAAQAADTTQQAPGYYRMTLGKLTVTAVSDGTVTIPLDQLLVPIDKETLQRRMAEDAMTPQAETSLNTFVIDDGKQRVLVDTGAGQLFGNNGGHLLENLRAAGYPADSINAVLLTHVHGDHSGGVSQQGKPTFPNADVYVDKRDPDFWLNDANQSKVEESQRHTFKESADALNPLIAAGKLKTFSAPARLPLGIQAQAAYGHTPGSVTYRVESEGQTLVLWGDIIHAKAVQMPEPQVAIHFDVDRRQAIATRERILAQAAKEGFWVAAAHISFPGLGHVQREGSGYRWVPANYSTQLAK